MGINSGEVSSLPTKEVAVLQCWKSPAPTEDCAIFQCSSSPSPWHCHPWEVRHQPTMPCSTREKLILKASKLHSFLLRALALEAPIFAVPQKKACIVGGCRRSALPGGRFRCSGTETPTLSHCSETLLSSSQGTVLLAVARVQQRGTEQLY